MDTEHHHITVNLGALLSDLQRTLQLSVNLVALALKSELPREHEELRLPAGTFATTFSRRLQWTAEETASHYHTWAISNGLRDAIEGVSSFIEETHRVLSAWLLIGSPNTERRILRSEWMTEIEGAAFHRLGLPDKLNHLQVDHGIVLDGDLTRHMLSVNKARNCLVHRRGIVGTRDVDDLNVLDVEWRKLKMILQDEDGERDLVLGQTVEKECWICAKVVDDKKTFALGQQIAFSVQDFADITWGMFTFGSELVRRVNEYGQSKGFVVSPEPGPKPDNLPASPADSS